MVLRYAVGVLAALVLGPVLAATGHALVRLLAGAAEGLGHLTRGGTTGVIGTSAVVALGGGVLAASVRRRGRSLLLVAGSLLGVLDRACLQPPVGSAPRPPRGVVVPPLSSGLLRRSRAGAGTVALAAALAGCGLFRTDPAPPAPAPTVSATGQGAASRADATPTPDPTSASPDTRSPSPDTATSATAPGGDPVDGDHRDADLPLRVDGYEFGGDAGASPRPTTDERALLRAPSDGRTRQAADCRQLAEPGWEAECGTAITSGGTLAWLVEQLGEGAGDGAVRGSVWLARADGTWTQALTTADRALEGYSGAAGEVLTLPDGSEHVLLTFYREGTGMIIDAEIVGGTGSVMSRFSVYKGAVTTEDSGIELSYPVYRLGDPNAAPSGGSATATLQWLDDQWQVTELRHEPSTP